MKKAATQINRLQYQVIKEQMMKRDFEFVIASESMQPLIQVGDRVRVQHVTPDKIQKWDIVIYWANEQLNCHFVAHVNQAIQADSKKMIFITHGLNNLREDIPITEDQILGRVSSHRMTRKLIFLLWLKKKILGKSER